MNSERTIPAAVHAALLDLALWQHNAPIDLTESQIDACSVAESALTEPLGLIDGIVTLHGHLLVLTFEHDDGALTHLFPEEA